MRRWRWGRIHMTHTQRPHAEEKNGSYNMNFYASAPPQPETILASLHQVEFPTRPAASSEAKEFIRKCLAYRQDLRWDVQTAAQDPYLSLSAKPGAAGSAAAAVAAAGAARKGSAATSGFESLLREIQS